MPRKSLKSRTASLKSRKGIKGFMPLDEVKEFDQKTVLIECGIACPDIEESWPEEQELNGWVSEVDEDEDEEVQDEDWQILKISSNVLNLTWKENADRSLKSKYLGTARSSLYRKKQKSRIHEEHCQDNLRLTTMGFTVTPSVANIIEEEEVSSPNGNEKLQIAIKNISEDLNKWKNGQPTLNQFDFLRSQSVKMYLMRLLEGKKKIESAKQIAKEIWNKDTAYFCRAIRQWSSSFLKTGMISKFQQGKHSKRPSLLDDEDVQLTICKYIRTLNPKDRNMPDIQKYINEFVLPRKIGLPGSISLRTTYRYMKLWDFIWKESGQQVRCSISLKFREGVFIITHNTQFFATTLVYLDLL